MARKNTSKPLWAMRADPQVMSQTIPCTAIPGSRSPSKMQQTLNSCSSKTASIRKLQRRMHMMLRVLRSRCQSRMIRNMIGIRMELCKDLVPYTDKKLSRWCKDTMPVIEKAAEDCRLEITIDESGLPKVW